MLSVSFRNIDFVSVRKVAYVISVCAIAASLLSLAIKGLNLGLDFTGGTQVELSFPDATDTSAVREVVAQAGFDQASIQHFGSKADILLRLPVSQHQDSADLTDKLLDGFKNRGDTVPTIRRIEIIGSQVGGELLEKGTLSVIITLGGIALYIWIRFERRFALGALLATAHDPLLILGYFSLTGMDFDLTVLAAVLAVLGYSVNDTVVVFDRIRENFRKMRKATPAQVINSAINQTMSRSLITSGTTLITVVAMLVLGGPMLRGFSVALMIGIVVGTYSSIFVASTVALDLGANRGELMPIDKETGEPLDTMP